MSLAEELLLLMGYEFIWICSAISNYIHYLDGNCWRHNAISSGNHSMQNALHYPLSFGCFEATGEVSGRCRKSAYGISRRLTHRQYSEHHVFVSSDRWHGHRFVADLSKLNNLSNFRSCRIIWHRMWPFGKNPRDYSQLGFRTFVPIARGSTRTCQKEQVSPMSCQWLNAADLLCRLRKAVQLIQQCLDKSGIVEQGALENLSDFIENMKNNI